MKIIYSGQSSRAPVVDISGFAYFENDKRIQATLQKKFQGKAGQALLTFPSDASSQGASFYIGLGSREKFTLQKVRTALCKLSAQAKSLRAASAAIHLDGFIERFSLKEIAAAAAEGVCLSSYRFDKYKSKREKPTGLEVFYFISGKAEKKEELSRAIGQAQILCDGVTFTRNLANEPANVMTPPRLAQAAREMASKNNLSCRVLGLSEIKRLKMGGLLGVSQGSSFPPQFIILENRVKASAKAPIVLVGKGVTFDTGGISIKPAGDMDKMKFDMCGAAAVIGAMKAIANLKIPVKVIGLAAVCENMPSATAQRPGDIITCMNGKTIEVLNTDAEGRLILADALAYAERFKPRALVDIATLTGACAATFADLLSGLMSTDPDLARRLKEAGEYTGERLWELPLYEEYFDLIKATYADIQNISKKYAGTITAGMFLKEFAGHTKAWAHLDIAGTAWNESGPKPLSPIGATGVGVRLFVRLVKSYARN